MRTPWGWLRGFAWFLVAWPLLSLMALDEFGDEDWGTILVAVLGPAAIGLFLLAVDWVLSKTLGKRMAARGQAPPNIFRDISNTALTYLVLLGIGTFIGLLDDPDAMSDRTFVRQALLVLGVSGGISVAFRALGVWVHGKPRFVDQGAAWDADPDLMRFLGYLFLIPMLLVSTVMLSYALDPKGDDEFGLTAWLILPVVLMLALRSAQARAPRYWARTPWEAWLRGVSLSAPWWTVAVLLMVGFTAITIILPFNPDKSMSTTGQILTGVILTPLGLFTGFVVVMALCKSLPAWFRCIVASRALKRDPDQLASWQAKRVQGQKGRAGGPGARHDEVSVRLRDGRQADFSFIVDDGREHWMVDWLATHHPEQYVG